MTEVAGETVRAAIEPPVQEQVAAVAGADRRPGEVALIYSRDPDRFGQRRLARICGDADGQLKAPADQLAEGRITPTQVGNQDGIARLRVDIAAQADAEPQLAGDFMPRPLDMRGQYRQDAFEIAGLINPRRRLAPPISTASTGFAVDALIGIASARGGQL